MTSKTLLTGGCVLTLGAKTPNFRQADVLIDQGVVAEVGPGLRARDAEHVDATDTIVMPGFVDTHRHAWTSLFRNLGDRSPLGDPSRPAASFDEHFQAEDLYAATLIGLLGAAEAGITTVVDWSNVRPDDGLAEAALEAHADAGLRTVYVQAAHPGRHGLDEPAARRLLARLAEIAGPSTRVVIGTDVAGPADLEHVSGQWALGRDLGLRIHAHVGSDSSARGVISTFGERGLLGEDVSLVHCTDLDDADLAAIESSGASVSLAPCRDMTAGIGSPPIQALVDRDILPGLGVDDERVAPGDMFAQMRATISLQHATVFDLKLAGKAGLPKLMSTRDVIRLATVEGARAAGLSAVSGSLEPGMQADVIMLRADRPNIFPVNDPIGAVVWGMDTSNVDWVFVGGRVVMRAGVLEADVHRARSLAADARRRVSDGSESIVGAASGGGR